MVVWIQKFADLTFFWSQNFGFLTVFGTVNFLDSKFFVKPVKGALSFPPAGERDICQSKQDKWNLLGPCYENV